MRWTELCCLGYPFNIDTKCMRNHGLILPRGWYFDFYKLVKLLEYKGKMGKNCAYQTGPCDSLALSANYAFIYVFLSWIMWWLSSTRLQSWPSWARLYIVLRFLFYEAKSIMNPWTKCLFLIFSVQVCLYLPSI